MRVPGQPAGIPARTSSSGAPLSWTSGTSATTPATRRSRAPPARARSARLPTAAEAATASPTIAATERAGPHVALFHRRAAAGCSRPPPQQQRAGAHRAAELGAVIVSASAPARGEVDGHLPHGLHRVGVEGDADGVRGLRQRGDVAHRADLVVGPHHARDRDVPTVAERLGQRLRGDGAGRLDRDPGDVGAVVLGQPLHAVEHGVVLGGADDDAAALRVGVPARPEQALDGEVVALGTAAGEQHLRRARAECLGQPFRACSAERRAARPLACSEEALPPGPAARSWRPSQDLGSTGVVAAWSRYVTWPPRWRYAVMVTTLSG